MLTVKFTHFLHANSMPGVEGRMQPAANDVSITCGNVCILVVGPNHTNGAQERLKLPVLAWLQAANHKAVPQGIHPAAAQG